MRLFYHMAIDLGTTYSVAWLASAEGYFQEPTFVALKQNNRQNNRLPLAIGNEAKRMHGLAPRNIEVIQPLREGVISDFEVCSAFLQSLIKKILGRRKGIVRNVLFCLPWGATDVEVRAYRKQLELYPFSRIYLIREPLAAALGADLSIEDPNGNILVDLGGGTTEITTLALNGIVQCISLKIGGNNMDEAIRQAIESKNHFCIGPTTAEKIKIDHGSIAPVIEDYAFEIKGFHRFYHLPRKIELNTADIRAALEASAQKVLQGINTAFETLTPELAADISTNGVTLAGGGAYLKGWTERIHRRFHLPVQRPAEPHLCVIRGMKKVLTRLKDYRFLLEE
ncbi:MAG: rod shape-determining protein [Desulfobacterota bacterium]|jgi:rod shape-determining protein MreB|nr:rod shape-determining protein [Thermodesulfobacteriota bacterium]